MTGEEAMANALKLMGVSIGAALVACQTLPPPNEALDEARSALAMARSQPVVVRSAAVELERAQQALARAERAWAKERGEAEVRHLAYLASQRVAIARGVAAHREAEERLQQARLELERVRARVREQAARHAAGATAASTVRARLGSEPILDDEVAPLPTHSSDLHAAGMSAAAPLAEGAKPASAGLPDASGPAGNDADSAFVDALDALAAQRTSRGTVINLPGSLYAAGQPALTPAARAPVEKLAGVMQRFPQRRLLVEAFTDGLGREAANLELSRQRAEAFRLALAEHGVALARLEVRAHGAAYPVADNATPAGRQRNERIEILFSDAQGRFRP